MVMNTKHNGKPKKQMKKLGCQLLTLVFNSNSNSVRTDQTLTQIGAFQVFEFTSLAHVAVGTFAVVEYRLADAHEEAGRTVQTVPLRVRLRTLVGLKGDIWSNFG